jgi:hypothetical protein
MRGSSDGRMKRAALGALAVVAAVAVIVTFPRWNSPSPSLGQTPPPGGRTSTSLPPDMSATTRPPEVLPTVPPGVDPELPSPPPIDTALALADPCAVLTPRLLQGVGVGAAPWRDGTWGCVADDGQRAVEVAIREPESDNPSVTSWNYQKAHDEEPRPIGPSSYVFELRDGDATTITIICADVVVSLSLPVEDVEEELVLDLIEDLS